MREIAAAQITETWVEPPPEGRLAHRPGDQVVIGVRYRSNEPMAVRGRLILHSHDGVFLLNASTLDVTGEDLAPSAGISQFRFVIDDLPLADGTYLITLVLQRPDETAEYDRQEQELSFDVRNDGPVWGRVMMNLSVQAP